MSKLRDKNTQPAEFRKLLRDIAMLLGVEASRDLQTSPVEGLHSPLAPYTGNCLTDRIGLSPILRAGMGMTDAFLDLFPEASVFFLGLFREKVSLEPVEYYQKLPNIPTVDTIFLLDPILATGGTAIAACNMLVDSGIPISRIKLVTILASMPGLKSVLRDCPGLEVWCGTVDQELAKGGMILPGLGDGGDRLFNTFDDA
ncbi:hypothetical protein CROQUDRAFT_653557 [Cronartium quercuum f. sp. fusiforme G11]|uniref:uracil phosphoribosyltransferase n=1 Tax=Cronartium quercuum f. sp. fusiforme G11 TaxID=708437 RepID=A0A9P6TEF5_9BASI|nr:hypothetical protein CROQUDRAFT_653557 [Cronartium quercuum f. sp. fusiforme G11]